MTRRVGGVLAVLSLLLAPEADAQIDEVSVLVAAKDLPTHSQLDETMVSVERIPGKYVQPGAVTKMEDVFGVYTATRIPKGTQLTSTLLMSLDELGAAFRIEKGYRSLTLPLDPSGPIGDVLPGNYVDLIFVGRSPKGTGSTAATVIQNVRVLAVGSDTGSIPVLRPGERRERRVREDPPSTLSVMVTPDEAARLALALETGALRVSLRSLWEGNTQVPVEPAFFPLPLRPKTR